MTKINRTPANKKPYNLFGTLAWEECEGGVRIAALQEKAFSVTIPREIEGMPVVALGNGCFAGQETLEEIILPDTLREVGSFAFAGCRALRVLNLPDSVEVLGSHMIQDTAITAFTLPRGVTALPVGVFSYCKGLETVVLHDGLRSIGAHAFFNTRVGEAEPLVLPDSVENIEAGAFFNVCGPISLKTTLPVDPFWTSDLPAPHDPQSHLSFSLNLKAGKVLRDAAARLAPVSAEARLLRELGVVTSKEARGRVWNAYWEVHLSMREQLAALRKEQGAAWSEEDLRYLNDLLLLSCGLRYVFSDGDVKVGLAEEKDPD